MSSPPWSVADQTWIELDAVASNSVLLIPFGSTEQHGPHLPLDTDTRIAFAVAATVAQRRADTLVAPPVPYGSSGEHAGFAGTLSIGHAALELLLIELVRSADVFRAVVLVCGHGGNAEAMQRATATLTAEGRPTRAWFASIPDGDAHAGHAETSLMLAVAPDTVRLDQAVAGATAPLSELMPDLRRAGVLAVSPNGVLGDPTGASASAGHQFLARLSADLDRLVDDLVTP